MTKGKVEPATVRFGRLVEVMPDGCWLWQGWINNWGYGIFTVGHQRRTQAHRWSHTQFIGPIPEGYEVDHLCRVRHCVNPAHLEAVTHRENQRRGTSPMAANARKTECPHGHPYTPENTYLRPDGRGRQCRTCNKARIFKPKSQRTTNRKAVA